MAILSLAEMQAKMAEGEVRDFDFWRSVFESFVHQRDSIQAPVVVEVAATMVREKRIPVSGGMLAWPNSVILVDGVPLINGSDEEYVLTSFGISEGADRSFTLGERIVIFKKA
jgi:hypothetical protein